MTLAMLLVLAGAALIYAGWKGYSFSEMIQGRLS